MHVRLPVGHFPFERVSQTTLPEVAESIKFTSSSIASTAGVGLFGVACVSVDYAYDLPFLTTARLPSP